MWSKITLDIQSKKRKNLMDYYFENGNKFEFKSRYNCLAYTLNRFKNKNNLFIEDFKDRKNMNKLYIHMFDTVYFLKNELTKEEQLVHMDLIENSVLTKDLKINKDKETYDKGMEVLVDFAFESIKKSFKDIKDAYIKGVGSYTMLSFSNKELKSYLLFAKKEFIDEIKTKERIKRTYEHHISKMRLFEIEDIEIENETAYLLDFTVNINEMIKDKKFFRIEKYKVEKRTATVNGEYIRFLPLNKKNRQFQDVSISNTYNNQIEGGGYTVYTKDNTFLFFNEKEAMLKGIDKLHDLKQAMKIFEEIEISNY